MLEGMTKHKVKAQNIKSGTKHKRGVGRGKEWGGERETAMRGESREQGREKKGLG